MVNAVHQSASNNNSAACTTVYPPGPLLVCLLPRPCQGLVPMVDHDAALGDLGKDCPDLGVGVAALALVGENDDETDAEPDSAPEPEVANVGTRAGRGGRGRGGGESGRGNGRGRPKGAAKCAAASSRRHKYSQDDQRKKEEDIWKKCKTCSKHKSCSDFNGGQADCKECTLDKRGLKRQAENQQCVDDFKNMDQESKEYKALMKAYNKARLKAVETGEKIKFSINKFRQEWKASEGTRKDNEGEMMWEGEYMEWATTTAKAGWLSKTEAAANWKKWFDDPSWPRDHDGPRSYLRLWVATKTKISKYEDVSKSRSLQQEEMLGKDPKKAKIEDRMKQVMGNFGPNANDPCDFDELQERAKKAFASGPQGSSSFADGGLLGPTDIGQLRRDVRAKQKRPLRAQDSAEGNEAEEPGDDDGEGGDDEPKVSPQKEWLDETKIRKAQRAYMITVTNLETSMIQQLQQMEAIMAEFRREPASKEHTD